LVWQGALERVGKKVGARGEAFGGRAQGSPPTRAGFLEEKKFCAILRADESGGNDLGVVENQNIPQGKQCRKIPDQVIGEVLGFPLDQEKACGIPRVGRSSGDPIRREVIGKQGRKGRGVSSPLTGGVAWTMIH